MKLNFDTIRKRIENEKDNHSGSWANFVGVPSNMVSNIHGKMQQNPSLSYIVNVAKATGKSVDYYLWGDDSPTPKAIRTPQHFLDQPRANRIIKNLSFLEATDKETYARVEGYIESSVSAVERTGQKNTAAATSDATRKTGT